MKIKTYSDFLILESTFRWNDLKIAVHNNDIEKVELILKDGKVDPSTQQNLAIRWASENGKKEIVDLLLKDKRVNPGDVDNYAIRLASEKGYYKIVE